MCQFLPHSPVEVYHENWAKNSLPRFASDSWIIQGDDNLVTLSLSFLKRFYKQPQGLWFLITLTHFLHRKMKIKPHSPIPLHQEIDPQLASTFYLSTRAWCFKRPLLLVFYSTCCYSIHDQPLNGHSSKCWNWSLQWIRMLVLPNDDSRWLPFSL